MIIRLLHDGEQVNATLDERSGELVEAVTESGELLDEVQLLQLELEYIDVIQEYLNS